MLNWLRQLFTTTDPDAALRRRLRHSQTVLRSEAQFCDDAEYQRHLRSLLVDGATDWDGRPRWQDRPLAMEVEQALREACQILPQGSSLWAEPLQRLAERQQQPEPPDQLAADMRSPDWVRRFTARQTLVTVGGEAVPTLVGLATEAELPLGQTARWLLRSIEVETLDRLSERAGYLLCSGCLVTCATRLADPAGRLSYVYCGCRACGQSRDFLEWPGPVVAVLDAGWPESQDQQNGRLRVNWLSRRSLFDFNEVEILQATDKEVEQFAVQVGNDTDPFRKPGYKKMRCVIGPDCRLLENTLRILRHTFGRVEPPA